MYRSSFTISIRRSFEYTNGRLSERERPEVKGTDVLLPGVCVYVAKGIKTQENLGASTEGQHDVDFRYGVLKRLVRTHLRLSRINETKVTGPRIITHWRFSPTGEEIGDP